MKIWILAVVALMAVVLTSGCIAPAELGLSSVETMFKPSLSHFYHTNIDPAFPNALDIFENNCMTAGGTWVDQNDAVGCFSIPSGVFDSRTCVSDPRIVILHNMCDSMETAQWVCTSDNAGCYY